MSVFIYTWAASVNFSTTWAAFWNAAANSKSALNIVNAGKNPMPSFTSRTSRASSRIPASNRLRFNSSALNAARPVSACSLNASALSAAAFATVTTALAAAAAGNLLTANCTLSANAWAFFAVFWAASVEFCATTNLRICISVGEVILCWAVLCGLFSFDLVYVALICAWNIWTTSATMFFASSNILAASFALILLFEYLDFCFCCWV